MLWLFYGEVDAERVVEPFEPLTNRVNRLYTSVLKPKAASLSKNGIRTVTAADLTARWLLGTLKTVFSDGGGSVVDQAPRALSLAKALTSAISKLGVENGEGQPQGADIDQLEDVNAILSRPITKKS